MSSESDDDEMTDEFPRQDEWMSSELLLLQHIQNLLASRGRAAAAGVVQQQPPLAFAFPRQDGWMSSDDDEMTDEFPRQNQDGWMSSDGDEVTDEFPLKKSRSRRVEEL
jgi:hypothetical protein